MRRRTVGSLAGMVFWSTAALFAQMPADLSGTWLRLGPAKDPAALEMLEPDVQDITQSDGAVQLRRRWPLKNEVEQFTPDGQEREDNSHPGGNARVTTHWDNGRLVTVHRQTVSLPAGTANVTVREVRWVENDRLILEITWASESKTLVRRLEYSRGNQ